MKNYVIYLLLVVWPVFVVSQTLSSDYDRSNTNVVKIDDRYLIASDTFGEEGKGSVKVHYVPEDETLLMTTFIPNNYLSGREREMFNNMTVTERYERLVGRVPDELIIAESMIAAKRAEAEESVWFPGSAPSLPLATGEEDPCDDTPENPEWPVPLPPCPEPEPEPTDPDPTEPDPEPGTGKPPQPTPPSGKPITPWCWDHSDDNIAPALIYFLIYYQHLYSCSGSLENGAPDKFVGNYDGDFFIENWSESSSIDVWRIKQGSLLARISYKKNGQWKVGEQQLNVDQDFIDSEGSFNLFVTHIASKKTRVELSRNEEGTTYDFTIMLAKHGWKNYPEFGDVIDLFSDCDEIFLNGEKTNCK